jgi:hypothetical protein
MCSLFLHCPAGTSIVGVLSINLNGNIQKRPIEHTYTEVRRGVSTGSVEWRMYICIYYESGLDLIVSEYYEEWRNANVEGSWLNMWRARLLGTHTPL